MRTASSACRTCRADASASEYTATVRMPILCAVRKMRQAISPRLATRRLRNRFAMLVARMYRRRLHAEEAEARVLFGRVASGSERQRENAPRLERIDHSVVPESRGGVVRMALALVLLANGLLESLLFLRRPTAA